MKYLYTLLFLSSLIDLSAQNWPETDTWWAYKLTSTSDVRYQFINVISDTLILEKNAKVLESTIFSYNVNPETGEKLLYHTEKVSEKMYLYSDGGKVYHLYVDEWRLLYDFNLDINDKFDLSGIDSLLCFDSSTNMEFSLPHTDEMTVSEISTYEYVNHEVTEIKLENTQYWGYNSQGIFKNIGPKGSFLPQPKCILASQYYVTDALGCFYSPSTGLLFVDEFNDDVCMEMQLVRSVEFENSNTNTQMLVVFPNPVTQNLTLSIEEVILSPITIVDALGRIVLTCEVDTEGRIDVQDLVPGLYTVRVEKDKKIMTANFIKI